MLAITVDIEDWYHIPSVTGSTLSKFKSVEEFFEKWQGNYDYLTRPTIRTLDLLDKYDVKATFFIVADIIEHYPGLVERIAFRGHEVACHGLHHACKINPATKKMLMTQGEFEERTLKAKQMLEKVCGREVTGYRAPSAYISGWMIDSLEKLDFKYDSSVSVNSFYNKSDSPLKGVDTRPYYPRRGGLEPGDKRKILEIPWPYLKMGIRFPTAGGPLLRFFGARYILAGLNQSLKRGETVFYFHPIDISLEKFPTVVSTRRPFYWMIKGKTIENRLINILAGKQFKKCTCQDIWIKIAKEVP